MTVASCYFVMPWHVVPLLGGWYLDQCRKCSISWKLATVLNKWTKENARAVIQLLQALNLEPMNNHRQVVTICGCRCNVCPAGAEMVLVTANGRVSWTRIEVVVVHKYGP